jgi:sugar lactone lactonase YvrE
MGESPRWREGRLWFANWGTQEIVAVDLDGIAEVVVHVPTTLPYSLDWLPDGRMLVVSGPEGLLLVREPGGDLTPHADLNLLSAQGWNEIVVDRRGNAYVNGGGPPPPPGEMFGPGGIALVAPDGAVRQVAHDIAFPNGMAVTPDNGTLIVADSFGRKLLAFDIAAAGDLANRRVWADLGDGAPDGICLDAEGAVWYADVPNRCCVRVREGGAVLQTVPIDRGCFACMLGGDDRSTLFILAAEWRGFDHIPSEGRTGQLLSVEAPAPGVGYP